MQFDDRLDTVLRTSTASERAARTQYRQLLDLVGATPGRIDDDTLGRALDRLAALSQEIAVADCAAMVGERGLRLRNARLVGWLAQREYQVASAAMANARLEPAHWLEIIPTLPVTARGMLRNRRDLPEGVLALLSRLGVHDLVLPEPAQPDADPELTRAIPLTATDPADILVLDEALVADAADDAEHGDIAALMRRIEAFQKARRAAVQPASPAPRLPLGDKPDDDVRRQAQAFDFTTDTEGRVNWADPALAPMIVGMALASNRPDAAAQCCVEVYTALRRHQTIRNGRISLSGAPAIAGQWRIDATPHFTLPDGSFTGYRGRLRRLPKPAASAAEWDQAADRMRQVLHELRTPVNAIQGFAEVIQQQIFGQVPNEYRALAAAIGVDIAKIQAGFDELERLARLETHSLTLDDGASDLAEVAPELIRRLTGALRPRSASIEWKADQAITQVGLCANDLQALLWRILATIGSAIAPGEMLEAELRAQDGSARLALELPASLDDKDDIFAASDPQAARVVSGGMFGVGFTLRLARAEAQAAGGTLTREGIQLVLTLPLLTAPVVANTLAAEAANPGSPARG